MGAFHGPRDWGKLLTAMVTPFDDSGAVDFDEAARLAATLVDDARSDGLVVAGTTGEAPTLTEGEKLGLLRCVLEAVGDRAAVLFGAGTYSTAESVHLARAAEQAGAHGIMVVNPYYNRPGQAGLEAHFRAVAAATGLPVMLYNIPGRTGINLEVATLLRLAEVPNIVAVKEASGSIGQISDACAGVPEGFRVYSGDDGLTLPILSVGGYGLVSVASHVAGPEIARLIEIFPTDPGEARRIHHRLTPLFKILFAWPSPVPVKYALSRRGFRCERVRLPLVELDESAKRAVEEVLASL